MKPAIIIPVYNHPESIAEVVRVAREQNLPVFVVDDGSSDGTGDTVEALEGITVLHHDRNRGKGAAILTGCSAALEKGCNYAVTIDGDGQHNPAETGLLLAAAGEEIRSIVIGRREGMNGGKNVPWTSRFGREFSNFWVRLSGGPNVRDTQSGFRLYPIPEILQLGVRARRYEFEVEVLVRARQNSIRILEVPVQVVYQERGRRVSHFHPWVDFLRNTATFARLICARIIRGAGPGRP